MRTRYQCGGETLSGRVVSQRRCCVILGRAGRALAAAALVEQDEGVALQIKKPGGRANLLGGIRDDHRRARDGHAWRTGCRQPQPLSATERRRAASEAPRLGGWAWA